MATKAQWKQPDGEGGFEVVHHETSAEMVKYGGRNVKDYLDSLSGAGVSLSTFVRGLATAEDATAARAVLQTSKENYFDETGNRWTSSGAMLSDAQSKFGSTSLYLNGSTSYLRRVQQATLGGADFSIAGWFYITAAFTATRALFSFGDSDTNKFGVSANSSNNLYWWCTTNKTSRWSSSDFTMTCPVGEWFHVEITYSQSGNTLRLFVNGDLKNTQEVSALENAWTYPFYIGNSVTDTSYAFKGYIDDFLIYDAALHTANFSVPTAPYHIRDKNIALLHFGIDKIADSTGAIWYNNGATLSTTQKKSGSKSLYCNGTFLQRGSKLTLGGKDFSISCWIYGTGTPSSAQYFFSWGDSTDRILFARNTSNQLYWYAAGTDSWGTADMDSTPDFTSGAWYHVEACYRNSDNAFMLFVNGVLKDTQTALGFASARTKTFCIGTSCVNVSATFKGYIDNFFITEKLLHDDDFTPPTSYSADSKTLALLDFE